MHWICVQLVEQSSCQYKPSFVWGFQLHQHDSCEKMCCINLVPYCFAQAEKTIWITQNTIIRSDISWYINTGRKISVGHGHLSDPFVKLSDEERKNTGHSVRPKVHCGLIFVRPNYINVPRNHRRKDWLLLTYQPVNILVRAVISSAWALQVEFSLSEFRLRGY